MKILLLGKGGMLGACFLDKLSGIEGVELKALGRDELDVCDFKALEFIVGDFEPDFLINCTAYAQVDAAEEDQESAFAVNAAAVGHMARCCKNVGATFIHFSTDYVFPGDCPDGYPEDAKTGPALNVYGASKLEGERLIQESACDFYIVRTAWLFARSGPNFVDTMLRLASERDALSIVDDQFGSPTYCEDLVAAVVDNFLINEQACGVYHLTNSGSCSWYQFALEIFQLRGLDVKVEAVDSSAFPRPAERPSYSILLNTKLRPMRPWQEALKDYLRR